MSASPERDPHDEFAQAAKEASDLGRYAGLGFQFVATLALFGGLGWWLDSKLSWSPWLLVTGILLGGGVAFAQIVLSVNRATRSNAPSNGERTPTNSGGKRPPTNSGGKRPPTNVLGGRRPPTNSGPGGS